MVSQFGVTVGPTVGIEPAVLAHTSVGSGASSLTMRPLAPLIMGAGSDKTHPLAPHLAQDCTLVPPPLLSTVTAVTQRHPEG